MEQQKEKAVMVQVPLVKLTFHGKVTLIWPGWWLCTAMIAALQTLAGGGWWSGLMFILSMVMLPISYKFAVDMINDIACGKAVEAIQQKIQMAIHDLKKAEETAQGDKS